MPFTLRLWILIALFYWTIIGLLEYNGSGATSMTDLATAVIAPPLVILSLMLLLRWVFKPRWRPRASGRTFE